MISKMQDLLFPAEMMCDVICHVLWIFAMRASLRQIIGMSFILRSFIQQPNLIEGYCGSIENCGGVDDVLDFGVGDVFCYERAVVLDEQAHLGVSLTSDKNAVLVALFSIEDAA